MALIKCKECGNEVSSEAKTCPKCGAKVPKGMGLLSKIFLGLFGFVVLSAVLSAVLNTHPTSPSAPSPSAPPPAPVKTYTPQEKAAALAKMAVEKDKVENETWYRDKSTPNTLGHNTFHLYIGQKPDHVWLRFRVEYSDSDWLFFHKIIVKADGLTFELSLFAPETYVGRGYVSEWIDVNMTKEQYALALAVAASKEATIRLVGRQFHKDRKITESEKKAILNVLQAYKVLGGKDF